MSPEPKKRIEIACKTPGRAPASSPAPRLLRESLCLADSLTGASPPQGPPSSLPQKPGENASPATTPRVAAGPCSRTNRMQLKDALCTCPPGVQSSQAPAPGFRQTSPPPHKRAVSGKTPASGNRSRRPPRSHTLPPAEHTAPSAFPLCPPRFAAQENAGTCRHVSAVPPV